MHKIIKGIVTIILATAITSAGVYAAFSTQSINKGNTIKAGTVKLVADSGPEMPGLQTVPLFDNLTSVKAGDIISRVIRISNAGSLGLAYNGLVSKTSGDDGLFSSFYLKIGTSSGLGDLYNGSLNGFTGFTGGNRYLVSGSGENIYFEISLPADAGEALKEKSVSFGFTFSATQSP